MESTGLDEMIRRWNKIKAECKDVDNESVLHLVRNSIEFDDQLALRKEREARQFDPAHLAAFKSDGPMCEADGE